jgi:hypothetical protein
VLTIAEVPSKVSETCRLPMITREDCLVPYDVTVRDSTPSLRPSLEADVACKVTCQGLGFWARWTWANFCFRLRSHRSTHHPPQPFAMNDPDAIRARIEEKRRLKEARKKEEREEEERMARDLAEAEARAEAMRREVERHAENERRAEEKARELAERKEAEAKAAAKAKETERLAALKKAVAEASKEAEDALARQSVGKSRRFSV